MDAGILDSVTQEFLNALKQDGSIISQAATHLFYYLVIFQLVLTALWFSLSGESLSSFVLKCAQLGFSFGFFYTLIQMGGEWIPALLNGFIEIGQKAGAPSLTPVNG